MSTLGDQWDIQFNTLGIERKPYLIVKRGETARMRYSSNEEALVFIDYLLHLPDAIHHRPWIDAVKPPKSRGIFLVIWKKIPPIVLNYHPGCLSQFHATTISLLHECGHGNLNAGGGPH